MAGPDDGLRGDNSPEIAGTVTIYDAEYRLLEIVSRHEQNNRCNTPYASQYPSSCHEELVSMTLREVRAHQERRMAQNRTYQAVGRYQFIYDTLEEVVNGSGTSWDAIFDVETQDWLAVYYMRSVGLNRWLDGSYSNAASNDNDVAWHVRLAMIWAAIPVPITIPAGTMGRNAPRQTRGPGDSFYQGSLNSAGATGPQEFLRDLRAIRAAGRGNANAVSIPLVADPDRARPAGDPTNRAATPGNGNYVSPNRAAGARGAAIRNGGTPFIPYGICLGPSDASPYTYKPLDQLDNRYDFRIGDKVRDLLENGQTGASNIDQQFCGSSRGGSGNVVGESGTEAGSGTQTSTGVGGQEADERDADGNLVPRPGESITEFQNRLREDNPALSYNDFSDQDVDDVLAGRTPRQYNPNTGEFEYPLVTRQNSGTSTNTSTGTRELPDPNEARLAQLRAERNRIDAQLIQLEDQGIFSGSQYQSLVDSLRQNADEIQAAGGSLGNVTIR